MSASEQLVAILVFLIILLGSQFAPGEQRFIFSYNAVGFWALCLWQSDNEFVLILI